MELVIDSNIVISALIRDSLTRKIILDSNHRFYAPEFLRTEVEKYEELITEKSGLKESEVETLLNLVLGEVEVLPIESYEHKLEKAENLIGEEDIKDVPFLAVALHKECKIWSDDKDLQQQEKVEVKNTEEIIELHGES
ncbi:PIN domain-containing protein [Candidatus Nanohalobium constans]|uniref:DNA-binding protein n=1 Tax=Candidatus Nanohalobium constans TaxID=2565781 RepID=A0A5Q0UF17_9ARCH|nr:PIN domain-containing protein [Candidatus Nanohalobium constans]QGA80193.1 DNA-binding protein [Candidatus Nanohalobium constans]